jgi:molybdopterin synthase sulfur carrier subunit
MQTQSIKINVTVKFFTILREIVGKKEEKFELSHPATLNVLLRRLSQKYGKEFNDHVYDEFGTVHGYLHLLVNCKSVETLQGLKTKLKEGDQIAILPPVGGG